MLCAERFCNSVIRTDEEWFQIGITIAENPDGPVVTSVNPQGPAGLSHQVVAGDVIIKWNGVSRRLFTKQQMMDVSCANWLGADVHLELQRFGEPQLITVCLTPVSPQNYCSWHEHVSKIAPLDTSVVVEPCSSSINREFFHTLGVRGANYGIYDIAVEAYFLKKKFGRHGWKGLDDLFPEGYRRKHYREIGPNVESRLRAMDANPAIWSLYFQEDDL